MTPITRGEAVTHVRGAFEAAADTYDAPPLAFRNRFGRELVSRLPLAPGMRVLDVAAGSGASAIPAAMRVGRGGSVVAIDLSGRLLGLGRAKATRLGLANLNFVVGDFLEFKSPPEGFDAVICGFGIFLVPDIAGAIGQLWSMVRPGGTLGLATWGPRLFEPAQEIFWEAVRTERADLYRGYNLWDPVSSEDSLRSVMQAGGVPNPTVELVAGAHGIESGDQWWTIILGSGSRGVVEQLDGDTRERVRQRVVADIDARAVRTLEAHVVYAQATRPAV